MAKSPAFQFYPTDFLGDDKIQLMDAEEVGMYWLLCCVAWQQKPRGTLPNDDDLLARWARVKRDVWDSKNGNVKRCFKLKRGRLHQERLVREGKKQANWQEKSRQGGIKSGERRREGSLKGGSRVVEPKGNTPTPSPTPSSIHTNKRKKGEGFEDFWKVYPRKRSKAQAEKAWNKIAPDEELQKQIVEALKTTVAKDFSQRPLDKVPYPATWLNSRGFEDVLGATGHHKTAPKALRVAPKCSCGELLLTKIEQNLGCCSLCEEKRVRGVGSDVVH